MNTLFAPRALLPTGWAASVLLDWNDSGELTRVDPGAEAPIGSDHATGPLLPGLPNLHSHAFQRAFAGLSEYRTENRTSTSDSFWTWRDLMYRFALAISPDQLEAIATQLYVEMLRAGYTSVCEFHYLHHDPAGRPYADPAEMSMRLLSAARAAGIGITLLPVLYQQAGFGAQPPRADQRRFINRVDRLLAIVDGARRQGARVGIAPHSLRAVTPEALDELLSGLHAIDPTAPVHIHIAEQQQEVDDCLAWSGQRPVRWLLDHAPVDARWCLVHATHLDAGETRALAASGAVAGLCPTTEANLGDGVFDALAYTQAGGAWGVGSDSHASVSAAEELRLLEYTQRLAHQRRNVLASDAHPQVADRLWLGAVAGGAQASGHVVSHAGANIHAHTKAGLVVAGRADWIVLDTSRALAGLSAPQALASHLFANQGRDAVHDVWAGGRQVVRAGTHALQESALRRFVAARQQLLAEA